MAGKRSRDDAKVKVFIEEMGLGRTPTAAARRAQYSSPFKQGKALIADPDILAQVQEIQKQNQKNAEMTREEVMKNLLDAYGIARSMDDPQSMIRAMAEVNRMCGHYAPEKKEINIGGQATIVHAEIQLLSKEDLLLMLGQPEETPLLESLPGEYEVEDENEEV